MSPSDLLILQTALKLRVPKSGMTHSNVALVSVLSKRTFAECLVTLQRYGYAAGEPVAPPVAEFSGTPLTGTAPLSVDFTDESTGDPTSWLWERNDGGGWATFSTDQSPQNVEFTEGTWSVRLTASNATGSDTDTKTDYITVAAAGARYWRISNFIGTGASLWETTQVQLLDGVSVLTGGITPTASSAPSSGNLADLSDGVLDSGAVSWSTEVANTLSLTYDFTSSVSIDGVKISQFDNALRFPLRLIVESSPNASDWTYQGIASPISPAANYTLCATAPFSDPAGHRYWRIKNFTGTTASYFETNEIQLFSGDTVVVSCAITPTASSAPEGGTLPPLSDRTLSGSTYWPTATANTLSLTYDLGSIATVTGIKLSRVDTTGRMPTNVDLEYSDNGSDWTAAGSASPVDPGTNNTLSALAVFS